MFRPGRARSANVACVIPADRLLAFAALSLVVIAIPGPSVLFVVGRALAHGRRVALASVAGNELGALTLAMLVAVGLGPLIQRSELLLTVIKLAGAGYLIVLGFRAFRDRKLHKLGEELAGRTQGGLRAVRDGYLVGVANPKLAVFFIAILPQFVSQSRGDVSVQMLLLSVLFVLIAAVCDGAWSLVASGARAWFAQSPRRLAAVGGAGGLAMIGLGVTLAATGRKN
jgi:threonine/homoserine/homoserine lactone efflux protein